MSLFGIEKWNPKSPEKPEWTNPYWPIAIVGFALAIYGMVHLFFTLIFEFK